MVKTTDATFNGNTYESVVRIGDIVSFEGRFWLVDKLDEIINNVNKLKNYSLSLDFS